MRAVLVIIAMLLLAVKPADEGGPTLKKRTLFSGASGYSVCSCYVQAQCGRLRCEAGTSSCMRCVVYDDDGAKQTVTLACPAAQECQ